MTINKCRVCGHGFFEEYLLKYKNMPAVAQHLPDANSLEKDKGINLEVYQCSGCGLVQLNNDPVSYYKKVIRASGFSDEMNNFRMEQFKKFVGKHSLKGKKIVEIGCGKGEYLSIIQQFGVEAYGLEEAEDSVQQCVKGGLKVSKGFVQSKNDKIDDGPFDAFFILNFLEHLPDVNSTLKGIGNNLIEDAVGIVEVPNFDMILREKLFSEFMRDHLFYFTKDTLKTTLELNGFEIIECKEIWHDYILSVVVKKRKKLDITHFNKSQEKLKTEIEEYLNLFGDKKVGIWGAGHQALAIISLMGLAEKIKYVVDSATFKQGKYTPSTHIPIVSPETLNSDPVEAIIVMAASYSDEIVRIIRQEYDKKIKIAILRDFGLEVLEGD
tara:strand:- start:1378 stop:2523 length:1146 start_codon:yes stop_codon:yes gene_type:complete